GASPRATLHLLRAAKATAALDDRDYVLPDDVQRLAMPMLAHRLLVTAEAQIARKGAQQIVADIVTRPTRPDSTERGQQRCGRPCTGSPLRNAASSMPASPLPSAHSCSASATCCASPCS